MNMMKYIVVVIAALLFTACGKEEEKYKIPSAPVSFSIDLGYLDNHLDTGGNVGIYLKDSNTKKKYDELVSDVKYVKTYLATRASLTSYAGFSGLLIINIGDGLSDTPFNVFDLCCPYEDQESIRVVPTDNITLVCPSCQSVYNLYSGARISGITSQSLQSYYIKKTGNTSFLVYYP